MLTFSLDVLSVSFFEALSELSVLLSASLLSFSEEDTLSLSSLSEAESPSVKTAESA